MQTYYLIIVFIYGLLLGSFYNVVGYRIPNNLSIIKPGSFCPKCKHRLKWYELIPVISFLIQSGKCRKCKCKISLFYPLIELLTGILFALSYHIFGFSMEFLIAILIASFLVIVIVSDFNYLIIPDEVTITFSILSVLVQLIMNFNIGITSIIYGIFLFLLMFIIMIIGNKIFKEESLGGGDVKLMFFVGTVLNVTNPIILSDLTTLTNLMNGFFEIFLSSCLASPFALFSFFSKKDRVIPFGPFILLAALIMFLTSFNTISFLRII
ncbi:MAG: prepilin peptidase [Bacilli bacterium]|nr:prepilin peptidase [Bacilli bacterium]